MNPARPKLADRPECERAYQEVTNGTKPCKQRMVSRNESEGFKPRNFIVAMGQGLLCSEASIVAGVIRRAMHHDGAWQVCYGVPGSQAAAGHPTDCIGTWDSRIACMLQQTEEVRRSHGNTAVGPVHSRGVAGVMPGGGSRNRDPLEGAGSQSYRAEEVWAIHRNG